MLRQEQEVETPSLPAAQVRVTPEELSQALASIEERKQAEASRLAGTIPIDQAVSELHLESTSEEIWAEVQAQRARAAAAQQEQTRREQRRQEQAAQQQAAQSQAQAARPQFIAPRPRRRRGWTGFIAPLVVLWVLVHNGIIPHFWSHPTHAAAPILRPLAQIPDGKEVYADGSALVQISEGKPSAQITVSENANDNRWTLVKIGAHVYLRGYIANTASLQPLQGKALNVYNDDNSGELRGEKTSNITLRVDKIPLQKSGGDDGYSGITVPNFQPDPLTTLSPWR